MKEAELEEAGAERRLKILLGFGTPAPPNLDNDDDVEEVNVSEKPWAQGMGPDEHYYACTGEGNPINRGWAPPWCRSNSRRCGHTGHLCDPRARLC